MSSLNKWDLRLLNKHLTRYKKLEAGEVKPSSAKSKKGQLSNTQKKAEPAPSQVKNSRSVKI